MILRNIHIVNIKSIIIDNEIWKVNQNKKKTVNEIIS